VRIYFVQHYCLCQFILSSTTVCVNLFCPVPLFVRIYFVQHHCLCGFILTVTAARSSACPSYFIPWHFLKISILEALFWLLLSSLNRKFHYHEVQQKVPVPYKIQRICAILLRVWKFHWRVCMSIYVCICFIPSYCSGMSHPIEINCGSFREIFSRRTVALVWSVYMFSVKFCDLSFGFCLKNGLQLSLG
jgi:hypothetical protein